MSSRTGGGSSTTLKTSRATMVSRREEPPKESIARTWPVHIVLLLVACVVWWIASDMVNVERRLKDACTVQFDLDKSLEGQWRIVSDSRVKIGLDVEGPTKEINDFAGGLESQRIPFRYLYVVSADDVKNLEPDVATSRATLVVKMDDLKRDNESSVPTELKVAPVGRESGFQIVLERFITRPASVDLKAGITGNIAGWRYTAKVQDGFALNVRGPASEVERLRKLDGHVHVQINPTDVSMILQTKARVEERTIEEILNTGVTLANIQLSPVEDVEFMKPDGNTMVAQVPVEFHFEQLQDYTTVSGEFPVSVILPNWLLQKGAKVVGLARTLPIELEILRSQQPAFNDRNINIRIDLSGVRRADLTINEPEDAGPGPRSTRITNVYYSLHMNRDKLTWRFKNPSVTAEQYLPVEVEVVWTE